MSKSRFALVTGLTLALGVLACNFPGVGATPAVAPPLAGDASPSPVASVAPTPSGPLPDLVVEILGIDSATIHLAVEPWTWVHYRITNIGQSATLVEPKGGFMVNGEPPSGYLQVEGILEPGATYESSFAVGHEAGSWTAGTYTVVVIVDHFEEVAESDEGNNLSGEITFEVVVP